MDGGSTGPGSSIKTQVNRQSKVPIVVRTLSNIAYMSARDWWGAGHVTSYWPLIGAGDQGGG